MVVIKIRIWLKQLRSGNRRRSQKNESRFPHRETIPPPAIFCIKAACMQWWCILHSIDDHSEDSVCRCLMVSATLAYYTRVVYLVAINCRDGWDGQADAQPTEGESQLPASIRLWHKSSDSRMCIMCTPTTFCLWIFVTSRIRQCCYSLIHFL